MSKNILVFPCGSEIGLAIYRSLKYSIHFKLYGASSIDDHGRFVYENHISGMPFVNDDNFIDALNKIIDENNIDLVFPAHDSVVLKCAQNAGKLHCKVLASDAQVCEIARSKLKTYNLLQNTIRTPKIFSINCISEYPVFLKPDVGQGSKGCVKANTREEVEIALRKDKSLLILEYLPGKEYTIDCFSDEKGELQYIQGRQRARILNGISANSFPVNDERFVMWAKKISQVVNFKGVWFFQVKEDKKGDLCLMEIAPRIAGTMEINRMQGVNLPLMWCFSALGYPVSILKNGYNIEIDRALANTFKLDINYDTIYVDFDDCLVTNGVVNYKIVAFLYKSFNQGKKIILLTKHAKNIKSSLREVKLFEIFDKIIHIKQTDEKYKYIDDCKSIFIDDSFAERKLVNQILGIPVFAPDMIDSLI